MLPYRPSPGRNKLCCCCTVHCPRRSDGEQHVFHLENVLGRWIHTFPWCYRREYCSDPSTVTRCGLPEQETKMNPTESNTKRDDASECHRNLSTRRSNDRIELYKGHKKVADLGAVDVFHCGGEAIDGEDSVPPFSTFDITRVNADYRNGLLEACTV